MVSLTHTNCSQEVARGTLAASVATFALDGYGMPSLWGSYNKDVGHVTLITAPGTAVTLASPLRGTQLPCQRSGSATMADCLPGLKKVWATSSTSRATVAGQLVDP